MGTSGTTGSGTTDEKEPIAVAMARIWQGEGLGAGSGEGPRPETGGTARPRGRGGAGIGTGIRAPDPTKLTAPDLARLNALKAQIEANARLIAGTNVVNL